MRTLLLVPVLLLAGGTAWCADAPAVSAETSPADAAYTAMLAGIRAHPDDLTQRFYLFFDFATAFPADSRSVRLLYGSEGFDYNSPPAVQAEFQENFARRMSAALARSDLPPELQQALAGMQAGRALILQERSSHPDLRALRATLDEFQAKYPEAPRANSLELSYATLLDKTDPTAAEAHLRKLAASPRETLARAATAALYVRSLRSTPPEIKFTAADGREVDLAGLRGKVVLLDFWATWCGPCLAELPNLKRVYETYHDRGFEVIGISFEQAPDTAAPKKFQKSREDFVAFTREKSMPWPQYYDGTYWENPFGARFGVRGIPAMFLLDQDGKVVSTNARGEVLEKEVKRLLKL